MIIRTQEQHHAHYERLASWHRYFALLPVTMNDGNTVWLQRVERRLEGGKARFDRDGLIRVWEYREQKPD